MTEGGQSGLRMSFQYSDADRADITRRAIRLLVPRAMPFLLVLGVLGAATPGTWRGWCWGVATGMVIYLIALVRQNVQTSHRVTTGTLAGRELVIDHGGARVESTQNIIHLNATTVSRLETWRSLVIVHTRWGYQLALPRRVLADPLIRARVDDAIVQPSRWTPGLVEPPAW